MVAAAAVGASVAAGVGSSMIGASGAKSAASTQAAAAEQAAQMQQAQYQQTRSDLLPYNTMGQGMLPTLSSYYDTTNSALNQAYGNVQSNIPQPMTEAQLVQTPGYQFNLSQGEKAVQNSAAAKGLGVSGTALKQAATYATGLADNTYQNQFNNAQTIYGDYNNQFTNKLNQQQQVYNQLYNPAALGENAAAQTGNIGATAMQNAGNSLQAAGQAQAAGIGTAAKLYGGAVNDIGSAGLNYLGLTNAMKSANGGSSGGGGNG